MLADLLSRQSWIWRKIGDGNKGNAVVGGEREWFLDLLSNKQAPVIDNIFSALEQVRGAVKEVEFLVGQLNRAFEGVKGAVQKYPESILKEKTDVLTTLINLVEKANPDKITSEFREVNKDVLDALKGRYEEIPARILRLGREVVRDFAKDVTAFQVTFEQLWRDLRELGHAVRHSPRPPVAASLSGDGGALSPAGLDES
jgi:hypothetical protein